MWMWMHKRSIVIHALLAALLVLFTLRLTEQCDGKFWISMFCLLVGIGSSLFASFRFTLDHIAAFSLNVAKLVLCWLYLFAVLAIELLLGPALSNVAFFCTQGALLILFAVLSLLLTVARERAMKNEYEKDSFILLQERLNYKLKRAKRRLRFMPREPRSHALDMLDGLIERTRILEPVLSFGGSDLDGCILRQADILLHDVTSLIVTRSDDLSTISSDMWAINELYDERLRQCDRIHWDEEPWWGRP